MSNEAKLRALLAEAREWVGGWSGMPWPSKDITALRNRIDAALAEPVKDEWDIETARSHHAGCAVYDDGGCTCGFRARRETLERSPLAVGDGSWSVFAEKVMRERDEARAEVERLRAKAMMVIGDRYREGWMKGRQHGAEAMREAAASCVGSDVALLQTYRSVLEGRIRDLPIPEGKP